MEDLSKKPMNEDKKVVVAMPPKDKDATQL
jgi:hypothetical protein